MNIIDVKTSSGEYPIILGCNIISELKKYTIPYDKILILSNEDIGDIYFEKLLWELNDERIKTFTIPEGEKFKNLETVSTIYDFMAKENFSRKSLIISLGGGVVCDMGGFVGATYMRGIDFIQVPTSLLAQVDASIGGKTAVDHPRGKNLIGVFKQPKAVLIDVEFLKTLPKEQFSSGMAEVIKHSLLLENRDYFRFLMERREEILSLESSSLIEMIKKSCEIKREIVEKDEFLIDRPIGKIGDELRRVELQPEDGGQIAQTKVKVLKRFQEKNLTLIEAELLTGRTHQIRAHMALEGYPLLGDELYGGADNRADRQMLHSYKTEFSDVETGDLKSIEVELPEDMKKLLE